MTYMLRADEVILSLSLCYNLRLEHAIKLWDCIAIDERVIMGMLHVQILGGIKSKRLINIHILLPRNFNGEVLSKIGGCHG